MNDGTCSDGLQNGDETGVDTGGRCATGACIDTNGDGIDDGSGISCTSVSAPAVQNDVYDTSLDTLEKKDWESLMQTYINDTISSHPLIQIAQGTKVEVSDTSCTVGPATVFGSSVSIDFCSIEWVFTLFGTVFVGVCSLRSVFIIFGID